MSRYEQFGANSIKDNNENARPSLLGVYQAVVVLNKQDEKIKELENKVFELNTKLNLKEHEPAFCKLAGKDCEFMGRIKELEKENRDQSIDFNFSLLERQNKLAIEELEKVKEEYCCDYEHLKKSKKLNIHGTYMLDFEENLIYYIDQRINELKGDKQSDTSL